MNRKDWLHCALVAVAVLTIVSGLVQVFATGFELRLLSSEDTPTSVHFFATVGMFMVVFGGALLNALLSPEPQPMLVLWCALQKVGACAAVAIGVVHHILSPLALLVAGFDLCSGILALWYWGRIRSAP